MIVFVSDKDTAKLYVQFFSTEITLYERFWSHAKNSQSCIIRFKNFQLRLEFLNLIIHSCSFFKQYLTEFYR